MNSATLNFFIKQVYLNSVIRIGIQYFKNQSLEIQLVKILKV